MTGIQLDLDQLRIINHRAYSTGISTVVGPPGCGKTTTSAALAVKLIAEQISTRVLLVAYTNGAANEFCRELHAILGESARNICLRTGYSGGVDPLSPIPFSGRADDIRNKQIIVDTTLSLKNLSRDIKFDNMIVDEAGIERLEHLLWPFLFGVNPMIPHLGPQDIADRIHGLMELLIECGVTATVVGDPKQSRPISPVSNDYSAIEWVSKRTTTDTLFTTHRLPDQLANLVNDFADYGGLKSADDIAGRRLVLSENPDPLFRNIISPEDVITWVDTNGEENPARELSWSNDIEAKCCAKICSEIRRTTRDKSVAVITRFTGQRVLIQSYLNQLGHRDIRVQTTTGALGTQADVGIYSLVRNNEERNVGAAGTLEDLNVAISRSKEKLIILGNFEMMLNGWSPVPTLISRGRRSPARRLAQLVESRYGKIVDGSSLTNMH